jgi:hypothetical protein
VRAIVHTAPLPICEKSGVAKKEVNSLKFLAIGTWTRCDALNCQLGLIRPSKALPPTPINTTTSGPGTKRSGPSLGRALSHHDRKARLASAISMAPGDRCSRTAVTMDEKVLLPSAWTNSKVPSKPPS